MNDFTNDTESSTDVIVAELVETGTVGTATIDTGTATAMAAPPTPLVFTPSGTDVATRPAAGSGFDSLLSTSEPTHPAADPLGSLRPTAFSFSDRPEPVRLRAGVGDWTSLVLAVVAPPIGLVLSIVVRVVSWRRTGWTSGVARTATVLGAVFTIIAVVGGVILSEIAGDAAAEAKIVSDSAPLCAALAETPGVLEAPAFGWPTEQGTLAETLVAMKAYKERWQSLADVAPSGISAGVNAVANAAKTLVTSVETNRSIDRAGNLAQMSVVTSSSGIPAFTGKYCG